MENNRLTRVLRMWTKDSITTIVMRRDDGAADQEIVLVPEVVAPLMAALVRASAMLERQDAITNAPVYVVTECQIFTTEQQHQGVALRAEQGFEIAMALDNPTVRAQLRACLDQLELPAHSDGLARVCVH